jgi:hypothetical protein
MHMDGQTDMMNVIGILCDYVNMPKHSWSHKN